MNEQRWSPAAKIDGLTFRVMRAAEISDVDRKTAHALFSATYHEANHAYLDKSLTRLRNIAFAYDGETAAGFGVGELRVLDLPRLHASHVMLAGMCCVDERYRRRGLFGALTSRAVAFEAQLPPGRSLSCGRMAHPASYRVMAREPNAVPKRGITPTSWQQEVGAAVARAYGVTEFDPTTFVCIGAGEPIGYPVMEVEVEPWEWDVFKPVDRARGDALLGICWRPDPPPGWEDEG